jgi:hypothetical protein
MRAYKSTVVVMAVLMMLLGFALIVAAGAGRLALMRRGR